MSKDENKKNLADLLEEYFPGAGQKAEQVLNNMFADGSLSSEETEQALEVTETAAEIFPEEEPAEIISLDGSEDDDTEDVPDEPFEVPEEAVETESARAAEELSTLSQWSDWADEAISANAAASEAFDSAEGEDVPEESDTEVTEDEGETDETEKNDEEEIPQKEASEETEKDEINEDEDINEKWLVRFAKGIFPVKGDGAFEVIRKIIFLAAVTVFVGAGIMLTSTLIQSQKAQDIQSSMHDLIVTTVASYIDTDGSVVTIPPTPDEIAAHIEEVKKNVKEINKDYIGFIEVAGCDIYEPVVKGEDNNYYLKHDIYGDQNKAGTIFMDYRCTVTPEYTSPNIVIYGHNQEDGTMFGRLKYYKVDYTQEPISIDFYKNNPVIKFNPDFESSEYLIYGFFVTNALENQDSNGEVFHYHDYIETMNDEYTFNWYLGEVQKRNQIISPVDVRFGDKLLVLSTCSNEFTNSRFVVFARKLREGESVSDYDFSEARFNPNAKGVDWEAILSGETSATEVPEAEEEEILNESTTHQKSLNKRNEKTYTTTTEEEETTTEAPAETTAVTTTVPASETSETETETAGSTESEDSAEGDESSDSSETDESETEVQTDENGEPAAETDENGETATYSETETSETTTTKKKKTTETSETSEVVTSKKKSNKSNK